jgi:uncharacterized protein with PhoU and TrkA domain
LDIRQFIEAIEPLQATTREASPEEDLQLMSITSLALSAKRIADAAEKIAQALGNGDAHALNSMLSNIAWDAGRSFAAGQRQS